MSACVVATRSLVAALDEGDCRGDDADGDEAGADRVDVLGGEDLLADEREEDADDEGEETEDEVLLGVHDGLQGTRR